MVCFIVLTGPVYYPHQLSDGRFRTWSVANKFAAVIIAIIFIGGWIAPFFLLDFSR